MGKYGLCNGSWWCSLICFDKSIIGPYVANLVNGVFTPENSTVIGLIKNNEIEAGVWYENYTKVSITAHIAITGKMTPKFLSTIFHYPYIQLGVDKIIAPVCSDNKKSIQMLHKFGFEEKARLLDVVPTGDLLFFVMTKDNCKYLKERYGKTI